MHCAIESVNLPEGLTTIAGSAFYWCTGLTSLRIPSTVTSIGATAFQGNALTELVVADGNEKYDSHGGCNAIIETATNTLVVGTPATVIPTDVTIIGNYAFNNMGRLTAMTIPEGVTTIGERAFATCQQLKEIKLPSTVTSIGANAFNYCDGMTKVTLGSGLTSIAKGVFGECKKVEDVYCYADPEALTWSDYADSKTFKTDKTTKFHVAPDVIDAWTTKFPEPNFIFVGDLNKVVNGDVNGDGDVDIADAVCIVNYVVGKPNTNFNDAAADVNGDGDIDIADAVYIVNIVVGKIQ
jgi:hypothetical protein